MMDVETPVLALHDTAGHQPEGDIRSVTRRRPLGSRATRLADDRVFTDVYPRLRRFAGVVGSAAIEPDDLVQDAVANTLRVHKLSELDYPLAYLRKAVLSAAVAQQRRRDTGKRLLGRLTSADTQPQSYPSDLADLDHLDERDRAILYLVDIEGLSYDEAADLLEESAQNARLRASRALRRLRAILRNEAAPDEAEEHNHD